MFRRLAVIGSLSGLATGLLTLAPAPALAYPDDTVPPSVSVTVPAVDGDNGWHRTPVDVRIRATDRSGISEQDSRVWLTGAESGDLAVVDGFVEHRITTPGHTTVHWEISDQEGNVSTGSRDVALDGGAPTASVVGGDRYAIQGTGLILRPDCAEPVSGLAACFLDGAVRQSGDQTILDTRAAVDVVVTAVAVDNAGNTTRTDRTYSVIAAGVAPVLSVTTATPTGDAGWFRQAPTFDIAATPGDPRVPVALVAHQIGSGQRTTVQADHTSVTVSDEGVQDLNAFAADVRSYQRGATVQVKVDTVAPKLWYTGPTTAVVGQDLVLAFDCHDATSGLAECTTNGQEGSYRVDTSQAGTVVLTGRARDRAGHVTTSEVLLEVRDAPLLQPSTTTLRVPGAVSSRQAPRATVTLGGWGATGGDVVVLDGARVLGRWTVPGTVALAPSDWSAPLTVTLPRLAPGTHRLAARYAGNQQTRPSASRVVTVVSKSPATVTTRYGVRAGRHQATVTVRGLDARATGRVTVLDRGRVVGSGTLRDGRAVVRLARLARGTARLTVRYAGSARVQAVTTRTTTLRLG